MSNKLFDSQIALVTEAARGKSLRDTGVTPARFHYEKFSANNVA
jgi:hypothetical protein